MVIWKGSEDLPNFHPRGNGANAVIQNERVLLALLDKLCRFAQGSLVVNWTEREESNPGKASKVTTPEGEKTGGRDKLEVDIGFLGFTHEGR